MKAYLQFLPRAEERRMTDLFPNRGQGLAGCLAGRVTG